MRGLRVREEATVSEERKLPRVEVQVVDPFQTVLDRLERKTIEAERNRAECLRLEVLADEANKSAVRAIRDAIERERDKRQEVVDERVGVVRAKVHSARAKLALGLEAFDRGGIGTGLTALLDAVRAAGAELDGVAP